MEGGVHQNLIRKFGFFGAGPELASAMLVEYRLRHNFVVGTSNRLGLEYKGHYDPWLTQHLDYLQMADRGLKHLAVEINTLKFRGSEQVFGICPLPYEEMQRLGNEKVKESRVSSSLSNPVYNVEKDLTIPNFKDTVYLKISSTLRERNSRYQFVASYQRTKYAVIAFHTLEEKLLVRRLLKDVLETSNRITLNFNLLAKKWNIFCEGTRVFYKTPEHLEKYHRHWKEQKLARTTHQAHHSAISLIQSQICKKSSVSVHLPLAVPSLPSQDNSRNLLTISTAPIDIVVPETPVPETTAPGYSHLISNYYYGTPVQSIPMPVPSSTQAQVDKPILPHPTILIQVIQMLLRKNAKDVVIFCVMEKCVDLTAKIPYVSITRANSVRAFGIK